MEQSRYKNRARSRRARYKNAVPASDTIVYIPLVLNDGNHVNAFLYARLNGTIQLKLYRANDYPDYGFGSLNDSLNNAEKLAVQCMLLDYHTFGHREFTLLDNRLLRNENIPGNPIMKNGSVHIAPVTSEQARGFEVWEYNICTSYQYLNCISNHSCCADGSCAACLELCWKTGTTCKKVSFLVYVDDGDPGGGGDPGEGGGGGGSGGGAGPEGQVPCNPTPEIDNGLLSCPRGNTTGWMPVLIPEPFNYQSTDTTFLKSISESISIASDSVFNWAFQPGNGLREQGGIIVYNNGQIYLKNLLPGREGGTKAINYSLAPGEILLGYFHTHPVDNDYKLRSFFSDDDFLEFHKNARTTQGYLMFLECGNKRFIVVVEDLQKYQAFMTIYRIKQLKRREIEYELTPGQPNIFSNGQQASIDAAIEFFGSTNNCGLGFYEADGPLKTNFDKLNP